jgi:hypothetical protein
MGLLGRFETTIALTISMRLVPQTPRFVFVFQIYCSLLFQDLLVIVLGLLFARVEHRVDGF